MRTLPISSALSAVCESLSVSRMGAICGGQAWSLGVRLAAQLACENIKSLYLCGDNRFDPYAAARFARSQQKSPEEALGRILVARAFTAYQLDELIHRLDPQKKLRRLSGSSSSQASARPSSMKTSHRPTRRDCSIARCGGCVIYRKKGCPCCLRKARRRKTLIALTF